MREGKLEQGEMRALMKLKEEKLVREDEWGTWGHEGKAYIVLSCDR